jgi:hypothetical protein
MSIYEGLFIRKAKGNLNASSLSKDKLERWPRLIRAEKKKCALNGTESFAVLQASQLAKQ